MKKYIIVIIIIGIILASALFYNIFSVQKKNVSTFYDSGYILKSQMNGNTNEIEKYYFNANENYKIKYGEKVVFKDTEGQEVVTDKYNFIHYSDGSISALENGVILNLEEIDADPINYYNIRASKVLKKVGSTYSIQHLDKELKFKNAIWKIADNKYLIIGEAIKLDFNDGTTKVINGYVQIEYLDNKIIKIYNQEATYQTIASNVSIEILESININLDTKIISKDGINKMTLENMVINSNDNIDIIDLDEYKEDENNTIENENQVENSENTENTENNTTDGNAVNSNTISGNGNENNNYGPNSNNGAYANSEQYGNNNGNLTNSENTNNTVDNNEMQDDDDNEYEYQEVITVNEPHFKVESFEVDSIKMTAEIVIEDEEGLLSDNIYVRIFKNSTGKKVYEREEDLGVYNINVEVANLEPNTEYTLAVESTYKIDENDYTKNFIYKIFRTENVGINIEKDYYTSNKLIFNVEIDESSKVKSADVVLKNVNGDILQTKEVTAEEINNVVFEELTSNTDYIIEITNVIYNGQLIADGFEMRYSCKTLKRIPTLENPVFEIDKRNSVFNLSLQTINDTDNGITSLKYVIYNKPTLGENEEQILGEPVFTIDANKNEQVLAYVNGTNLQRNVDYVYKAIAEFYDNEKVIEYESQISDCMSMAGNPYPTITFEARDITYERIIGNLIINEEEGQEIINKENIFTVVYTNSRGDVGSFTSTGNLIIPVELYGLKSNETYRFSIYTKADLQDGNGEVDKTYIGGAVVKTEKPNNLQAVYLPEVGPESFIVSLQLFNEYEEDEEGNKVFKNTRDLEASTLTGLTFNLYAGDDITNEPKASVTITDENAEAYESDIKKMCYDDKLKITPSFFRLSNSQIMQGANYIIEVKDAYDYTEYSNEIPILNSTYQIIGKASLPDLPTNVNDSMYVTPIYNKEKEDDKIEDLNDDTVVGYKVRAKYEQRSGVSIKEITYNVYMVSETGDVKIDTRTIQVNSSEDGVPEVEFNVDYGTPNYVDDKTQNVMRRGNSYYFTYTMKLEIDGQIINYPYTDTTILKSKTQTPLKQLSKIIMYPKTSNTNNITFKYKISDVDNSLITSQESPKTTNMYAYIENIQRSISPITIGEEEFQEVTFGNLLIGKLKLMINEQVTKGNIDNITPTTIVEQTFEGIVSLAPITYTVVNENNQLIIYLQNTTDFISRIGRFDLVFKNLNNEVILEKKYLKQENNNIKINLLELSELLGKTVRVEVYAYYDTGRIGFELENSDYVAYQRGSNNYYYTIANNLLTGNNALDDNIYQIKDQNQTDEGITLSLNKISEQDENLQTINLEYSQSGFRYEDSTIILQKEILRQQIDTSNTHTVTIDMISPGIKDLYGTGKIETSLEEAIFSATLVQVPGVNIDNQTIYIDIYETDEKGIIKEETKTTTARNTSEFEEQKQIVIENLKWQTKYAMKFRVQINGKDYYLYDTDAEVLGYEYTFSTLADVGIDNIQVEYVAKNYMEKNIHITHTLGRTTGYDKLRYQVYEYDSSKEGNLGTLIAREDVDHIFKNNEEYNILIAPGVYGTEDSVIQSGKIFEFNKKYIVVISAVKILANGREVLIEEKIADDTTEYKSRKEFILPSLENPNIAIAANRYEEEGKNHIEFRITVSDMYKVIKDGKYAMEITDEGGRTIQEEGYETSIDLINRSIKLEAETNKTYTIKIKVLVDLLNNGGTEEYIKEYTVSATGDISLGTISAEPSLERDYINLIFKNSYRLTELTKINYTIYTLDGYNKSGEINLSETPLELRYDGSTAYYILQLPEQTEKNKNYYIELNCYKNEELYQTNLEFIYTE